MRNVMLGLGFLAIGSATGYSLANPATQTTSSRERAAPAARGESAESMLCPGGSSSELEVDFSALASGTSGKERARLRIELRNRAKAPTKVAYAIEFVDDRGNALVPPMRGPRLEIAASARVEAAAFETPVGLTDGFYMARATVVAAGGVVTSEIRHVYFEARGGHLKEIEMGEYLTESDANKGVSL